MLRIYSNHESGESVVSINHREYPVVFFHEKGKNEKELDKFMLPLNRIIIPKYRKLVKDFIKKYSLDKRYSIHFTYLSYYRVFVAKLKLSTGGDDILIIGTLINFDFDEVPLGPPA